MIFKTNAEKLREAQEALHLLNLGQSARVFVDQNGERVEYTPANRAALERYVSQLELAVAAERSGGNVQRTPKNLKFLTKKGI